MKIASFWRTSSPENMAVSAMKKMPDVALKSKLFGFECGFYENGSLMTDSQLQKKGHNLFRKGGKTTSLLTCTGDIVENHFGSNESAYNLGKSLGQAHQYIVLDLENQWGNYDDPTTLDRVGHLLKGMKEEGALVGDFLYAVFSRNMVWDNDAKAQLQNPSINGVGTKIVPSLGVPLSSLYGLHKMIGYGNAYWTGKANHDPRYAIYNYIYQLRVNRKLRTQGKIPANTPSIGYLWGGCDSFNTGKPLINHRIYVDGGYVNIQHSNEEAASIMKGYAIWGMVEGDGVYYWTSTSMSDNRNDVIDILYSGFPHCSSTGNIALPPSRPEPVRIYPYQDGLSADAIHEGVYEVSFIQDSLEQGQFEDANYAFKREGDTNFQSVMRNNDDTAIVEDYLQARPVVLKIVDKKSVFFVIQDPVASQNAQTKIKLSHAKKTWFAATNADEPQILKFNL